MERREELRGGGLWITGALNRANRRVPLTNLFSLWWPGAGSAPSTFRFPDPPPLRTYIQESLVFNGFRAPRPTEKHPDSPR